MKQGFVRLFDQSVFFQNQDPFLILSKYLLWPDYQLSLHNNAYNNFSLQVSKDIVQITVMLLEHHRMWSLGETWSNFVRDVLLRDNPLHYWTFLMLLRDASRCKSWYPSMLLNVLHTTAHPPHYCTHVVWVMSQSEGSHFVALHCTSWGLVLKLCCAHWSTLVYYFGQIIENNSLLFGNNALLLVVQQWWCTRIPIWQGAFQVPFWKAESMLAIFCLTACLYPLHFNILLARSKCFCSVLLHCSCTVFGQINITLGALHKGNWQSTHFWPRQNKNSCARVCFVLQACCVCHRPGICFRWKKGIGCFTYQLFGVGKLLLPLHDLSFKTFFPGRSLFLLLFCLVIFRIRYQIPLNFAL